MKNILKQKSQLQPRLMWSMLLLMLCVSGVAAQDPKPGADRMGRPNPGADRMGRPNPKLADAIILQPPKSVRVEIRYSKDYGYQSESGGAFGGTGPTSCDAFLISFKLESGNRPENLIPVTREPKMRESGSYYVCDFLVSELPLNQKVTISAGISGRDATSAWRGGTQPQPPNGGRRVITDPTRIVTLTDSTTRASLAFEMVYEEPRSVERPRYKIPLFQKH